MTEPNQSHNRPITYLANPRERGVTAVLAMLFLMIFGSLAAAMAIVSQGNLRTADSHLKINRAMAAAETGMDLMVYRLDQVTQGDPDDLLTFPGVYTTDGLIHAGNFYDVDGNAYDMWAGPLADSSPGVAERLATALAGELNFASSGNPYVDTTSLGVDAFNRPIHQLVVPAVQIGPGAPSFSATLTPHELPLDLQPSTLGYDDPFYDRLPYGPPGGNPNGTAEEQADYRRDMAIKEEAGIDFIVAENIGYDSFFELDTKPLDARFIRVKVTAFDGDLDNQITDAELQSRRRVYRSISMDFRLDKTVPYAVLSRSRIMIGRNVQIKGNVGSRFTETDKNNGHPIQVQSDFIGLTDNLDSILSPPNSEYPSGGTFHNELVVNDINGDNRLDTRNALEIKDWPGGEVAAIAADLDGDGYLTDFDFFLAEFDTDTIDGRVTSGEFAGGVDSVSVNTATQLFEMMDTSGDEFRYGYNDGFIDGDDLYAKIRGQVSLKATASDWNDGLSDWGDTGGSTTPEYKDFLQGVIKPDYGASPLTTADPALDVHSFDQHSFNTKSFADLATVTVESQKGVDNGAATASESTTFEEVPYGAAYPYDYYDRPVYENMVFQDTRIPLGTNALFKNCRFVGVTFIEVSPDNDDENFNYVGMQEASGIAKHPDYSASVGGATVDDTKPYGNNIRFDDCAFEGPLVSGAPDGSQPAQFTHVRNKITFTGNTSFDFDKAPSEDEVKLYKRSSLLLPHVSVEMGSFQEGDSSDETLELSGAVVAGLIDMRGQIEVRGTLITTFEPVSGEAPVKGDTAPQFNTTLGYFSQGQGDLEADLPDGGLGKIRLIYDPTLALPDGIDGPLELRPLIQTYHESGQ
ncbi:MAG: hypothetical protein AAGA25_04085 [Planctomycetota bacterium]